MYKELEEGSILFEKDINLIRSYMRIIPEYIKFNEALDKIKKVTRLSEFEIDNITENALRLGDEIMKTKEEIMVENKKFTFIEVMIEMEGYIDDCKKNDTIPIRKYTDGCQEIYLDNEGDIILDRCEYAFFDRRWYLVK